MGTGSISHHDLTASPEAGHVADVLQTSCRRWKLLDILLIFSRTVLAGLLILGSAFAIDHWTYLLLQDGSLGSIGRWIYFLLLVVIYPPMSIYLIARSLKGRINPLFVAQQIEEVSPEIKNSISNFWQIRSTKHIHPSIVSSMGQRAVLDLDEDRAEDGVDTTSTSLWGYSSLACLAVTAIYFALMTGPSLQTIHRILIPWDTVQRPSEIVIKSVQPGDATITFGSSLEFTAELSGANANTPVFLITESTDGSTAQTRLPMQHNQGRFELLMDKSPLGIQRDFVYWIEAGHPQGRTAISEQFHVTVQPAASIRVTQLQYQFPAYTDLPDAVNSRQFQIEAVEGTSIKVSALANKEIASAWLQLRTPSGDTEKRMMLVEDEKVGTTDFELRVDASQTPAYVSYQIFFRAKDGATNPEAIEYSITTLQDLAPVIEFTRPAAREIRQGPIELPINQTLPLAWSAHDPDYELSSVDLVVTEPNQDDHRVELLKDNNRGEGKRVFRNDFTPGDFDLSPGTRITVYGEAADNRKTFSNPQPNRTQSELLVIHVTEAVEKTGDESQENMSDEMEMADSSSDNMEDKTEDSGNEDGMPKDGGDGAESGEGMTGGASETPEEGGDPDMENGGTGGKGSTSDNPDSGKGENTPTSQGMPGDANDTNSADGMSTDNSDDGMESENGGDGDGTASDENATSNQSGSNTGEETGENPTDGSVSNNDAENGTPTGEAGDDSHKNQPSQEGTSKPDDHHDGDIFEKLLERLRDTQSDSQKGNNQPQGQETGDNSSGGTENQNSDDNPGNNGENQASAGEGEGKANTQNGNPKSGDPTNAGEQNGDSNTDPNAKGTSTDDPLKEPRESNAGEGGEQVDEQGGNDITGQTGGTQQGDDSMGNSSDATGQSTTETPGSNDTMGTSGENQNSDGSQANPQSGTGQQDAVPKDELGLPEELEDNEEARLDYARKATDLALKYLSDHQDNPSDELLEDLGITAEQLREMVSRYEQLKQDNTQAGQQTLNETLKSLGLRPSAEIQARKVKTNRQDVQGVSGGGALSGLPPHLQQRFKSFRTGTTVSDE